jgi:hypothetical protein
METTVQIPQAFIEFLNLKGITDDNQIEIAFKSWIELTWSSITLTDKSVNTDKLFV